MRKNNKKIMIVVSVLLSLVLITSSIVSGTMAKYTTTSGQKSTSARVAKFGVELGVSLDEEFEKVCGNYTITANNGSILISVPNLKIGPEDDFSKALHVSISGRSEVKLKVSMDINVERKGNFILDETFGPNKNTIYFPIGMTLGCKNESDQYVNDYLMVPGNTAPDSMYETLLMIYFADRIFMDPVGEYYKDMSVESVFEPGEEIVFHPSVLDDTDGNNDPVGSVYINDFDLGFKWPFESDSTDKNANDKKDTWLVSQETVPSFGYTFTITVEQVS